MSSMAHVQPPPVVNLRIVRLYARYPRLVVDWEVRAFGIDRKIAGEVPDLVTLLGHEVCTVDLIADVVAEADVRAVVYVADLEPRAPLHGDDTSLDDRLRTVWARHVKMDGVTPAYVLLCHAAQRRQRWVARAIGENERIGYRLDRRSPEIVKTAVMYLMSA